MMTPRTLLLSLFVLSLSACGASRRPEATASAAPAKEQAASNKEARAAEGQQSDAAQQAGDSQYDRAVEEAAAEEAAAQPEAPTATSPERTPISGSEVVVTLPAVAQIPDDQLTSQLERRQEALLSSLSGQAERLNCEGGAIHRDAICEIAKRLCDDIESTSLDETKQCRAAEQSCSAAKKKYTQRCG